MGKGSWVIWYLCWYWGHRVEVFFSWCIQCDSLSLRCVSLLVQASITMISTSLMLWLGLLTPSRRVYVYFFSDPITGLFSVKIRKTFLAIKNFSVNDNQINASFIDISRIKWLVFLLWSSFFRTTSTVASSKAPADYQPDTPVEQTEFWRGIKDNGL